MTVTSIRNLGIPAVAVALADAIVPVGSRVTCNPPPTDTDVDYLILTRYFDEVETELDRLGWEPGGIAYEHSDPSQFASYRSGEVNIILTDDPEFCDKFRQATELARRLNVMDKEDRKALFQLVLYGNGPVAGATIKCRWGGPKVRFAGGMSADDLEPQTSP